LKILITNHALRDYTGSDIFTYVIADFLTRKGHTVTAYSKYLGKVAADLTRLDVRIVDDLSEISKERFDIAHVHHNINALEIRYYFSKIPMVFLSHGVLPTLEKPPYININLNHFLAVSEEVRDHLVSLGKEEHKVLVFRNIVDSEKFCPIKPIHKRPQAALVLSNKIDKICEEIITQACKDMGISCKFIGLNHEVAEQDRLPFEINEADIVFSLGRGVIETMLCGRIPIVFDHLGGDGMVTPSNFNDLKKSNFSGRRNRFRFNVTELKNEIEKYQTGSADIIRRLALEEFDANTNIERLTQIYLNIIEDKTDQPLTSLDWDLLEQFVLSIRETRHFFGVESDEVAAQWRNMYIENFHSGRGWRMLLKYYAVRDSLRKWIKRLR
jgi:hypothetical protein